MNSITKLNHFQFVRAPWTELFVALQNSWVMSASWLSVAWPQCCGKYHFTWHTQKNEFGAYSLLYSRGEKTSKCVSTRMRMENQDDHSNGQSLLIIVLSAENPLPKCVWKISIWYSGLPTDVVFARLFRVALSFESAASLNLNAKLFNKYFENKECNNKDRQKTHTLHKLVAGHHGFTTIEKVDLFTCCAAICDCFGAQLLSRASGPPEDTQQ